MIYLMEYIAIISGVLIGRFVFRKFINVLIAIIIFIPYYSKNRFDYLYSLADDRTTYQAFGNATIKRYVDYVRIHETSKPLAYKYFMHHYTEIVKVIAIKIAPLALLPAILFWVYWYWYVLGVVATVILSILYKIYVDKNGIGFYQKSMIFMVINDYMKDTK